MTTKLKAFNIYADLSLYLGLEIEAESLADAVERAKSLQTVDFVKILGEYCDDNAPIHIKGVYES